MDTLLKNGDFALDAKGLPYLAAGLDELLQRAYLRLQIPKGEFVYDPSMGNRAHLEKDADIRRTQIYDFAREALSPMNVTVLQADIEGDSMVVQIETEYGSGTVRAELLQEVGQEDGNLS